MPMLLLSLKAGQAFHLSDGIEWRAWTLSSWPDAAGEFAILVASDQSHSLPHHCLVEIWPGVHLAADHAQRLLMLFLPPAGMMVAHPVNIERNTLSDD